MGDKVTLKVEERDVHGKKVARLRREGIVPAVVYGPGIEPISVQVANNVLAKAYAQAGKHAPVHLTIGTKKKIAMIKDIDHDPIKRTIKHVAFHAVKASDPVVAEVPIHLIGEGESEAEKAGLIVLQALDKIEAKAKKVAAHLMEASPKDIEFQAGRARGERGVVLVVVGMFEHPYLLSRGGIESDGVDLRCGDLP